MKLRCTKAEDSSVRKYVPCCVPTARAFRTSWLVGSLQTLHPRTEARLAGSVCSVAATTSDYGMDIPAQSARVRWIRLEKKSFGPKRYMSVTNTMIYLLIGINVLTFVVYGVDKWKAKQGKWRISEATVPPCS